MTQRLRSTDDRKEGWGQGMNDLGIKSKRQFPKVNLLRKTPRWSKNPQTL